MIRLDQVTFTYPGARRPTLCDVTLEIPEGEWWLVVGETGSGKSTLLNTMNGLVPQFSGGHFSGAVSIDGRRTERLVPRELADVVGVVGQRPESGFVADVVEDELAYTMENLGIAPDAMRRRVEDVLDLLRLAPLRNRAVTTLSSGQRQRVAIGAVLTASPRLLVLDEPTSALDPGAAEEVLAAVQRLVHDLGMTVLMAEHRLERVVEYVDRIVQVTDGSVTIGSPDEMMAHSPVVPPVVALGRVAGWDPLPLSVRDARRRAGPLHDMLRSAQTTDFSGDPGPDVDRPVVGSVSKLDATYGATTVLKRVSMEVRAGEIVALMGRNGSGKTTLLRHLAGLIPPSAGQVQVTGGAPHDLDARTLIRGVGFVPDDPGVLLYAERLVDECHQVDLDAQLTPGTTHALVATLLGRVDDDVHPGDLSEGQRLALALATILAPEPPLLLLDEPTRGLDYPAKERLCEHLQVLAGRGHAVVLATHDVELVAEVATRVVVLADGEVVADGPTRSVVAHSPIFAPQVAKVLAPEPWLTVAEVRAALAGGLAS